MSNYPDGFDNKLLDGITEKEDNLLWDLALGITLLENLERWLDETKWIEITDIIDERIVSEWRRQLERLELPNNE